MPDFYKRHLPHWQPADELFFVTWLLEGAVPVKLRAVGWTSSGALFAERDRALDRASAGPLWLNNKRVADSVVNVLRETEARGLQRLQTWVIMPNHVHVLLKPSRPLREVIRDIKSQSAREANRILSRSGQPFWAREYYDRLVRDSVEEARMTRYIERNPVKASLCHHPEDWPWSSAYRRAMPGVHS